MEIHCICLQPTFPVSLDIAIHISFFYGIKSYIKSFRRAQNETTWSDEKLSPFPIDIDPLAWSLREVCSCNSVSELSSTVTKTDQSCKDQSLLQTFSRKLPTRS